MLIIEDDLKLAGLIGDFLRQHGFAVAAAHRGDTAADTARAFAPDLTVLDLMLPGLDGVQVCRQLRRFCTTPILMLTAREDDIDQILGLEAGADDYVVKPVEPRVLLARIRALLRRYRRAEAYRFGALRVDCGSRSASLQDRAIELTTMEFELLALFARRAGEVLSRDDILNQLRGIEFDGSDRSVDVCVSKLRRKLNDHPRDPRRIKTVWGRGYIFSPSAWEV